ncbi:GHKL domain-containing protein [Sulfurimonas aquatica]|uniref:histidine kinase n=1 Tax=Sulfurimonas aquatica TaxID=2672570 RepID=A0A975B262_9BACT|nr:HAMP domain-containing sensor histidine kinase [Sulfurimonas aquatica]QSZ42735.1 GHKL domain-containing protein [Sulfurimonas aquatica]
MTPTSNQQTIDDIVQISQSCDKTLKSKLTKLIIMYKKQEEYCNKIYDENQAFIKKCNEMHSLSNEEKEKKDKLIEQSARQAAMGEMIDVVAHQWKQPLNSISMIMDMLKNDFESSEVDKRYIEDLNQTVHMQIEHMVNTLGEFRNFLRPSTKDETFVLNNVINNVQLLLKDELLSQNVKLTVDIEDDISILGNKNEFKHIFINLISNSVDAFNENDSTDRNIFINAYKVSGYIYIEFQDNAGGISKEIISQIFKPNFTTKAEGKGTGVGLYMSKQIVKKNHGSINVRNSNIGALFTIKLREQTI